MDLPRQHNLETAAALAAERVARQGPEQLRWLGARESGGDWLLPVLGEELRIDLPSGAVGTAAGAAVSPFWQVLVLHYLGVQSQPPPMEPQLAFADFDSARPYAGVYHKRVIDRLCATVGRVASTLEAAAERLGAEWKPLGDLAFDLRPLPRLSIRIIWHAGDEEFPPSASFLYPPNIESFYVSEDIIVLSERLVSRLNGKPF